MWHGAYPGYYLTFLTGIVVTLAARAVSSQVLAQTLTDSLLNLLAASFVFLIPLKLLRLLRSGRLASTF